MDVIELEGGAKKVALDGRLDIEGTGEIELKFGAHTAAARVPVIVDLTEVTFLASIGMRLLVSNAKALQAAGCPLVLLNPQDPVRKALETAGINALIPIHDDETSALEAIGVSS